MTDMSYSRSRINMVFVYQKRASFIETDLGLLKQHYAVKEIQTQGKLSDLFKLAMEISKSDVVFCWFGKLHALWSLIFARTLRKKSIVVAGGDDVANTKEGYGIFAHPLKKWFGRLIFSLPDLVLPVSECTKRETIHNARVDEERIKMIYLAFDSRYFKKTESIKKEPIVISVGRITHETIVKKGLITFVKAAAFIPATRFIMIGPCDDGSVAVLKKAAAANVEFPDGMFGAELVTFMSRASVYVQASVHESFGCSVAEAMLCECVPVVSRRAALPEVVGDCGYYVDELTPKAFAEKIKDALEAAELMGMKARMRVIEQFPLDKREKELTNAINALHLS